jgi:ATP-dependent Clp protease protease subunit
MERHYLDAEGVIRLFGPVSTASVTPVIESILEHNLRRDRPRLRLYLDSPGGDVDQGFALLDVMQWSRIPIQTTGLGLVASMGVLLLMAGEKGARTIMPRCSVLSHRFAAATAGTHADLLASRVQEDLLHRRILDHYRRHTRLGDDAAIEAELLRANDRWLTPEQAVAFGLADRVWSADHSQEPS